VALGAALLASPLTWLGYLLVLLPVGYAYARCRSSVRAAAVLLSTPPVAMLTVLVDRDIVPHPAVLTSGTACAVVVLGLMAALVARGDPGTAEAVSELRADPGAC
jgi:hypothetical protein